MLLVHDHPLFQVSTSCRKKILSSFFIHAFLFLFVYTDYFPFITMDEDLVKLAEIYIQLGFSENALFELMQISTITSPEMRDRVFKLQNICFLCSLMKGGFFCNTKNSCSISGDKFNQVFFFSILLLLLFFFFFSLSLSDLNLYFSPPFMLHILLSLL